MLSPTALRGVCFSWYCLRLGSGSHFMVGAGGVWFCIPFFFFCCLVCGWRLFFLLAASASVWRSGGVFGVLAFVWLSGGASFACLPASVLASVCLLGLAGSGSATVSHFFCVWKGLGLAFPNVDKKRPFVDFICYFADFSLTLHYKYKGFELWLK